MAESKPASAEDPILAKVNVWLKSHRRSVLATVLGFAFLLRLTAFVELHDTPVMHSYEYTQMDMKFFDSWAMAIAAERDYLGRKPRHPLHIWHRGVAEAHFNANPELRGKTFDEMRPPEQKIAVAELWDDWYGGTRFHQEPFYPYFIAACYGLWGGPDARVVCVLQLCGGVLTVLLLFLATRALFGDLVAVITGAMVSLFSPLIHYEVTLLRAAIITLVGVALLYFSQRVIATRESRGAGQRYRLLGFGLLIGLATTVKTTFLLFALVMLVVVFWPLRKDPWRLARYAGLIVSGIAVFLVPCFIRNYLVGAPLLSLTSVAAVTFAGANYPGYVPAFGWYPFNDTEAVAQIMSESDGRFLAAVWASLGMHTIGGYLSLLWSKFILIWHWLEIPNNSNCYFSARHSVVLSVGQALVSAAWVMPAAVVGMTVALLQRRAVTLWLWYWLISIAPMMVFYVLSRFRVPMVVAMMPFAAFMIVSALDWLLRKRWLPLLGSLGGFAVLTILMCRDISPPRPVIDAGNYEFAIHYYYLPQVKAAGDPRTAAEIIDGLIATRPAYVDRIGPARPIADVYEHRMIREVWLDTYRLLLDAVTAQRDAGRAQRTRQTLARLQAAVNAYEAMPSGR